MNLNYFVCTLGQAATLTQKEKDFKTIPEFLRRQAKRVPDRPAVGFYQPSADSELLWTPRVITFGEVDRGTEGIAKRLSLCNQSHATEAQHVALLCPSSADFLFIWLALMRLGHSVLLIAPQCQPQAIAHLCKTCKVTRLYYDDGYGDLARRSVEAGADDSIKDFLVSVPEIVGKNIFETIREQTEGEIEVPHIDEHAVAYLHHTSGTSTGLPKPIPQSHHAGIGVLPCLDGSNKATFTTTPLYHGGIADLFRAWTSDALIWLFPGKEVPITASNIVRCLDVARHSAEEQKTPLVMYFSSVPYVLQMLSEDASGLDHLKAMDMVGVGGAALPAEVGNELVRKGVNLVSRFGSAECGFLMSSHRDYSKDKEWQYLRSSQGAEFLAFEKQEDGLSELVIKPGWPHMARTNREDGSFATADLFAPHPSIPNAWKYHSRADSQLTLITGKKFDPAPLESAIAASPLLNDVLIFGNGQPFPGALLFRSLQSQNMSDDELIEALVPQIEKLNSESQNHARIPRNMLIALPYAENTLEKSSKGSTLRGAAESRYGSEIERAYDKLDTTSGREVSDGDISIMILKSIKAIVGTKGVELTEDSDLFFYGVDSVVCVQIRHTLRQLLPVGMKDTPINIVEDCGTVRELQKYVVARRHGSDRRPQEDEDKLMEQLVKEYSQFLPMFPESMGKPSFTNGDVLDHQHGDTVVLTGATGALGAHILSQYLAMPTCTRIYCLVRGADEVSALERVRKSLKQRGLDASALTSTSCFALSANSSSKVRVLPAKLSDPRLGLADEDYARIAGEASLIIHCAWAVNFRLRLRSFVKDHIAGVRNLINLALSSSSSSSPSYHKVPRLLFCSSTASTSSYHAASIPESIITSPLSASPLGYSRSKWVAEQICHRCNTALRGRIAVLRVGQLSGDTKKGIWNASEAWPLMLSTARAVGALPDLHDEELGWLPVDLAAEAVVQIADSMDTNKEWVDDDDKMAGEVGVESSDMKTGKVTERMGGMVVCNILNQARPASTWSDLLQWLQKIGNNFEVVEPAVWVKRLEELDGEHPAKKLLGIWKEKYVRNADGNGYGRHPEDKNDMNCDQDGETNRTRTEGMTNYNSSEEAIEGRVTQGDKRYVISRAELMAPLLKDVKPVDEEYFGKIWTWLKESMIEGQEKG